jgi:hypothetical protein
MYYFSLDVIANHQTQWPNATRIYYLTALESSHSLLLKTEISPIRLQPQWGLLLSGGCWVLCAFLPFSTHPYSLTVSPPPPAVCHSSLCFSHHISFSGSNLLCLPLNKDCHDYTGPAWRVQDTLLMSGPLTSSHLQNPFCHVTWQLQVLGTRTRISLMGSPPHHIF